MLGWALIFLVIAIIAAFFGFGGIAGTAAGIAQTLMREFHAKCVKIYRLSKGEIVIFRAF
jgi:uncharacterized membrane protein YtjA (UPF0391 family)